MLLDISRTLEQVYWDKLLRTLDKVYWHKLSNQFNMKKLNKKKNHTIYKKKDITMRAHDVIACSWILERKGKPSIFNFFLLISSSLNN
jgi:hypothetical protein